MRIRAPLWLPYLLMGLSLCVDAREPDFEIGKEINELCAGCHGESGGG